MRRSSLACHVTATEPLASVKPRMNIPLLKPILEIPLLLQATAEEVLNQPNCATVREEMLRMHMMEVDEQRLWETEGAMAFHQPFVGMKLSKVQFRSVGLSVNDKYTEVRCSNRTVHSQRTYPKPPSCEWGL